MNSMPHWRHAILTFVVTVLAASILLPLIRVQPEAVHQYFKSLHDWVRVAFIFSLCVILVGALFRLLSPKLGHLTHWKTHPPAWLAALVGWIVVAVIDLSAGLSSDGYTANLVEWLGYGGGSVLLAGWQSGFSSEIFRRFRPAESPPDEPPEGVTVQDIENAPWSEVEAWLRSDGAAQYDFLGNQAVAHRVSLLVADGARSIGIVGPFGAGKTSITGWVRDRLTKLEVGGRKYLICHHSCWGFETSASAIHDMLGSAIEKVAECIDTFQVESLPDSYRQTLSAGGDWFEAVSNLVLSDTGPGEQFTRLSELLESIDGRLIFIVEDLDRNDTNGFEIQEVLAFLERLKDHPSFSFILTAGLTKSPEIDFAKLCDHIEFLQAIQPASASRLIERVAQQCLDNAAFPHHRLGNPSRNYEWNPLTGLLMSGHEEFSLPQAVASLLNTPRSLRHALGRTFSAWKTLHGEIDFNHLLAVNILRFGASEGFQFLLRRWDRLHSAPSQSSTGQGILDRNRQAITNDWHQTIANVEWNPDAAVRVMKFILPATEYWLVNSSSYQDPGGGLQCVSVERYWARAINEWIDAEQVTDQEVIRDILAWQAAPNTATDLVRRLTTSPGYADIWEYLAGGFFANQRDEILLLCEQVIRRILAEQTSGASYDSQGFAHTWRFARRRVANHPENQAWLKDRLLEAAPVSIRMVNGLWHHYGNPGSYSILRLGDGEPIRRFVLDTLEAQVVDGPTLVTRLSQDAPANGLYQLVFDPGTGTRFLADVQSWSWLGPHILDALRTKNIGTAANCAVLLGARVSSRDVMAADTEVLDCFFGSDAGEVIDMLDSVIDQLPESDQLLARNVVGAARQHLAVGDGLNRNNGDTEGSTT